MMSLSPVVLTWRSWESVAINVYNIPPGMSTFTLWESFKKEGHIITIDIFDNRGTSRPPGPGRGRIRFKYVYTLSAIFPVALFLRSNTIVSCR